MIQSVLIVAIIFLSFLTLIKILTDSRTRNKLIDKDMVNEKTKYLYANRFSTNIPSSLKWGMVLIGIGLAFLIGQIVSKDYSEEVIIGCLFIFPGLALIIYYIFAKKMENKK